MYVFNKITVNPQLPKRIEKLSEISNNLWWSWNTEFLRLFKTIEWLMGNLRKKSSKIFKTSITRKIRSCF